MVNTIQGHVNNPRLYFLLRCTSEVQLQVQGGVHEGRSVRTASVLPGLLVILTPVGGQFRTTDVTELEVTVLCLHPWLVNQFNLVLSKLWKRLCKLLLSCGASETCYLPAT